MRFRELYADVPLRSVLLAYDGTPPAEVALRRCAEIVSETRAKLTLVCVMPVTEGAIGLELPPGGTIADTVTAGRKMLDEARARAEKLGAGSAEAVLLEGDPVELIVDYAHRHRPDLIVVGSRGLSAPGRWILGSVSEGILRRTHCSVLVVKAEPAPTEPKAKRPPKGRPTPVE